MLSTAAAMAAAALMAGVVSISVVALRVTELTPPLPRPDARSDTDSLTMSPALLLTTTVSEPKTGKPL